MDDRADARLLLLRHGQSTWNAQGRWQGQADPPLSEQGELQARRAAGGLGAVAAIWTSDLARARRTAELLAPPGTPVRLDPRLRERHVGAWAGLTRDEIEGRYPGWLTGGRRPEGWEDDPVVGGRGLLALHDATRTLQPGATTLVVSHGGLLRAVVSQLGAQPWPVPNLGGVWLERDGDGFALGPRAALLDLDRSGRRWRAPRPIELSGRPTMDGPPIVD